MTPGEVRKYNEKLTIFIERWQEGPYPLLPPGYRSAFDMQAQIRRGRRNAMQRDRAVGDAYRVDLVEVADSKWSVVLMERTRDTWRTYAQLELQGVDRKPSVQVVRTTGNPVVVVDHAGMRGTGLSERLSSWYVARAGSLFPILEYPTEAHVSGWGMAFDRHIRSGVTRSPEVLAEGATLEVAFHVEYRASGPSDDSDGKSLFVVQKRLVLAWDESAELFVPTATSDLGVEDVGALMGDASDQFLRRYRDQVLHLAVSDDLRDKAFVLRLLDACSPGEAVDEVRRVAARSARRSDSS